MDTAAALAGLEAGLPFSDVIQTDQGRSDDSVADVAVNIDDHSVDAGLDVFGHGTDLHDGETGAGDWVCPGHLDPCFAMNCNPSITVYTADGSPSITSLRALSDACVVDEIASALGNRIVPADGGFPGTSAVVVFVGNSCSSGTAECEFEIYFANGSSTVITTSYSQGIPFKQGHCRDNSDCCDRSQYDEQVGTPCALFPRDFQLDVSPLADGGNAPIDSYSGTSDMPSGG